MPLGPKSTPTEVVNVTLLSNVSDDEVLALLTFRFCCPGVAPEPEILKLPTPVLVNIFLTPVPLV
jgi:hypothetical protein